MRIRAQLERFHNADIRKLLFGIIFTVGFLVLLVQYFGIPCRNASCSSTVKLSGIVDSQVSVVKSEMKYINLSNYDDDSDDGNGYEEEYEKGKRKNDSLPIIDREIDVAISSVKVGLDLSVIARPNVSLEKPIMAVESSVLVSGKDSREADLLSNLRHKQVAAVSISQMKTLLLQSLSSFQSPVRNFDS